jgi:hypothetical protein
MKHKLLRLLGKLSIIGYCFKHDLEHDLKFGYYGERTGCSKCQNKINPKKQNIMKDFDKYWNNSFLKKVDDINGEDYDSLKSFIQKAIQKSVEEREKEIIKKWKDLFDSDEDSDTIAGEFNDWLELSKPKK